MVDFDFTLGDDGTLDTVVVVTCNRCGESWELRYNPEPPEDAADLDYWDREAEVLDMAREDADSEGCQACRERLLEAWDMTCIKSFSGSLPRCDGGDS